MRTLNLSNDYGEWIANPRCENQGDEEKYLIANSSKIFVIGEIVDEDLSYEYDEFALILLGKKYYLLETSGCSCPSPTETWRVELGPTTLRKIRKYITDGNYSGYSLPSKKEEQFLAMIDEEIKRVKETKK